MAQSESDFIELAKKRFKLANSADNDQREREREDLRFYAGDQWPADVRASRSAQAASGGMPATPARPCLEINKVRGPVRQVLNEQMAADMGIEITAADDFGNLSQPVTDEEIELREGLVRRIQRNSDAEAARTWAFSRAAIGGRGYYRVNTRYLPGTWDQEISVESIFNQFSVSLDPGHQEADGSDADWEFIASDVPYNEYEAEYGTLKTADGDEIDADNDEQWRALGDDKEGWFTTDSESKTRMVRVVEYFYTVLESVELALMDDGSAIPVADVPKGITPRETRKDVRKSIKWAKINGITTLDETDWPSPHMPIVKVLGEELHPYDNKRRSEGIVHQAISANRGFNYMVSKQVESIALAPIPPWMIAEGQIEGYEAWYEQQNIRTLPWLVYRQRDLEGNPAPAPQRISPDVPIQAIAQSVGMFDQAIQSTTMVPDATLGQVDPSLRSGRTVQALVQQSQRGTSNYMDNLVRSMHYEAKIENSLLYPIYGRPGRLTRIVNGQEKSELVMLHKPFVMQNNRPMMAAPGMPGTKTFTLTENATFNIAIKVTKNYDTRRQEEAALVGGLIEKNPELMAVFGDLFLENLDGPGHQEMAARAKVMLAPPVQKLLSGQQPIPPEAQQQMQQQEGIIKALQAELSKSQQIIQAKQVEKQADLQESQIDNQTKLKIATINSETQIAIAELKATNDQILTALSAQAEYLRTLTDAAKEGRMSAEDQAHERTMQRDAQHHDVGMSAMQQDHEKTIQANEPEPAGV